MHALDDTTAYLPAVHAPVTADSPEVAQYDPAEHAAQALNPADAAKVPIKQDEQTEADAAEYFPATQLPLTADSPVVAQYDPAEHAVQALNPADAAKVPIKQEEQTDTDAAEYFPATQLPLTADSPEVAQYDPAEHAVQLVEPVLAA